MKKFLVLLALLALPAIPSLAQQSDPPPQTPAPAPQLPIAAMRHEQPSEDAVRQREIDREGAQKVEQRDTQQQHEVDQLYRQILQRSATPSQP